MKNIVCFFLLLSFPLWGIAQKVDRKKYDNMGFQYLRNSFRTYNSIQKTIFGYAELGYLEYQSSALLQKHLQEHGFKIEKGIAGIPTAFVATYGKRGPCIGLLAEFDALPGLSQDTVPYKKQLVADGSGHGCGHNLLGTASVAAAVAISKWLSNGHEGVIKLFGCPAEEGGGGKAYMVRENCFKGVDVVIDWHPDVNNIVNTASGLANVQIQFNFKGKAAHAASSPDKGRSALDAVEAFDFMMNLMREHVPSDSRIHYIITNGGQAPNIVPESASVLYFLRNPRRDVLVDLQKRAVAAAQGAAMGTETSMSYEIISGNYERLYNRSLSEILQKNLEYVGGISYNSNEKAFIDSIRKSSGLSLLGNQDNYKRILPLGSNYPTSKWVSSDVGNITWVVPTVSFRIASFAPAGSGHCWQQVASGGTTIGTKGLMNAAKVMFLTSYDLFTHPNYIQQAHQEFESKRGKDFVFVPLIGSRKPPLDYRLKK